MKVEKINENKIKITLTIDELKARKISIKDIEKDVNLAKNLFLDLLEESDLNEEFIADDSQLYIEASSDNNNLFVVTITKIEHIPELSKYALLDNILEKSIDKKSKNSLSLTKDSTKKKRDSEKINYKVDSTIYSFSSMDDILVMCEILAKEKIFLGKNSLYKYVNEYFIVFNKSSIKNKKFLRTFIVLSEYCKNYYTSSIFDISIKEKCKLIISDNALQKLIKL
ncbi:MAG: adaptor protein MecA [Clostridia bacterium]|nr:adaptor protein MecA [Clostridia bacterium]